MYSGWPPPTSAEEAGNEFRRVRSNLDKLRPELKPRFTRELGDYARSIGLVHFLEGHLDTALRWWREFVDLYLRGLEEYQAEDFAQGVLEHAAYFKEDPLLRAASIVDQEATSGWFPRLIAKVILRKDGEASRLLEGIREASREFERQREVEELIKAAFYAYWASRHPIRSTVREFRARLRRLKERSKLPQRLRRRPTLADTAVLDAIQSILDMDALTLVEHLTASTKSFKRDLERDELPVHEAGVTLVFLALCRGMKVTPADVPGRLRSYLPPVWEGLSRPL